MQSLEDQILGYAYVIYKKYHIDSVSLARLCYKTQCHVRMVKPVINVLVAKGLLSHRGNVNYAISYEGIKYVENKSLVKIRNWVIEE